MDGLLNKKLARSY